MNLSNKTRLQRLQGVTLQNQLPSTNHGFTIVELLVVIVVIGILATVTIVSYTGISQKAIAASLQSDLSSASKQLKLFQVDNSAYPNSIADCPTPSASNLCLKYSSGNTYSSYSANNSTNPQAFTLLATNGSNIYKVTNNTSPNQLTAVTTNPSTPAPVADWLATTQGDHYGNFYDLVTHNYASVTRAASAGAPAGTTGKTIYDPATQKIYDVPANYLAVNPRSDGKSGSEAVIEEGRTNYLKTSYFNADTNSDGLADNWTTNSSLGSSASYGLVGSSPYGDAQRLQYTSASDTNKQITTYNYSAIGSFAAGDNATGSFYYKGTVTGVTVSLHMEAYNSSYGQIGNSVDTTIVPSGSWQRGAYTWSSLPTNTSYVLLALKVYGVDTGDTFDISMSAAQIEKGAFSTSYIPTTTATVTRNADVVTVPTTGWNAAAGTFMAVHGLPVPTSPASAGYIMQVIGGNNVDRLLMGEAANNRNPYIAAYGDDVVFASAVRGITPNSPYVQAGTWSATQLITYVDGTATGPTATDAMTSLPSAVASIGSYNGGGNVGFFNGPISRLLTYSSALSDSDVTAVTNAIKDGP